MGFGQQDGQSPRSPAARGTFAGLSHKAASQGEGQGLVLQPAWRIRKSPASPGPKAPASPGARSTATPSAPRFRASSPGTGCEEPPTEPQPAQQPSVAPPAQQLPARPPAQQAQPSLPGGRPPFVPIKSWRTCWEVAEGMASLPPARLDQKLLSAALQHMANIHASRPSPSGRDAHACAQLLGLCEGRLHQFDAQGLTIVVRAAARLGHRLPTAQLGAWADAAVERLPEFKSQDLANSLFSIGKMEQRLPAAALRRFVAAVVATCGRMPPLELSPTLLGLAYMGAFPQEATPAAEAVLRQAPRRLRDFSPQELANLLWAFSKVTDLPSWQRCGGLLEALLDEVELRAGRGEFLPLEVNGLLMAQANMGFYHPGTLAALMRVVTADLSQLEGQHLGNALLALALLPHPGTPPIPAPCPGEGAAAEEAAAWSAAQPASHVDRRQVVALREEVERRLWRRPCLPQQALSSQAVCHALWGLAALQECNRSFWNTALAALRETHWQERAAGYGQLYHASLLLQTEDSDWAVLPEDIAGMAREAVQAIHDSWVSTMEEEVSALLDVLGIAHEQEFVPAEGLSPVDLAVPELKLAIEVDGPRHFTSNRVRGAYWPLGRTILRDRLLKASGWSVLSVPCFLWRGLRSREERLEWLMRRVEPFKAAVARGGK